MNPWFKILTAARRAFGKDSFDVEAFAKVAKIQAGTKSSARDNAAAWLAKFVRWGYARKTTRRRPFSYRLTKWGLERKAPGAWGAK